MIEKIIKRLTEKAIESSSALTEAIIGMQGASADFYSTEKSTYEKAIEIVQEVAKEYGKDTNVPSNGWIPYSERLPEKDQRCLVQYNGAMSGFEDYMDVDTFNGEMFEFFGSKYVVAWQPLPEKYQKGEHA